MNPRESPYSSSDGDGGERHPERVTYVFCIRTARNWENGSTFICWLSSTHSRNSSKHTTPHKTMNKTLKTTTSQLAGSKRWWNDRQPSTLCGHRALLYHACRASALSLMFDLQLLFIDNFAFHGNTASAVVAHGLIYSTYGIAPHRASRTNADLYLERWRWIRLEGKHGCADVLFFMHWSTRRRQ